MIVNVATSKTEIKQTSDVSTVLFLLKLPPSNVLQLPVGVEGEMHSIRILTYVIIA